MNGGTCFYQRCHFPGRLMKCSVVVKRIENLKKNYLIICLCIFYNLNLLEILLRSVQVLGSVSGTTPLSPNWPVMPEKYVILIL